MRGVNARDLQLPVRKFEQLSRYTREGSNDATGTKWIGSFVLLVSRQGEVVGHCSRNAPEFVAYRKWICESPLSRPTEILSSARQAQKQLTHSKWNEAARQNATVWNEQR